MKHPERVEDYLEHIETAIKRATEYTERLARRAEKRSVFRLCVPRRRPLT